MTSPGRSRGLAWALAALSLLLAFGASRLASTYIASASPDRPKPRDLLFELLPYAAWPQYVTDIALLIAAALAIAHLLRHRPKELPAGVALFGMMELARAVLIVLTPLAGPLGNGAHYGLVRVSQHGEFPSGHAATVMLFYLMVGKEEAPKTRGVMLALVVVECVALLVSHGHYSIDVVGGLLLASALHRLWTQGAALGWLRRLATA